MLSEVNEGKVVARLIKHGATVSVLKKQVIVTTRLSMRDNELKSAIYVTTRPMITSSTVSKI